MTSNGVSTFLQINSMEISHCYSPIFIIIMSVTINICVKSASQTERKTSPNAKIDMQSCKRKGEERKCLCYLSQSLMRRPNTVICKRVLGTEYSVSILKSLFLEVSL